MRARIIVTSFIAGAAGLLPMVTPGAAVAAAPTSTIVVADTSLGIGESSPVVVTFSEPVTGFTVADLTAENGILSGLSTSDNITYTLTLTPTGGATRAGNVITLDNSLVANGSLEPGAGVTTSNSYAVDTVRPTVTVVVADADLRAGETSLVTFSFSEAVVGLTAADVTAANGSLDAPSSSDGGLTWTAILTPSPAVEAPANVITIDNTGVADLAGNAGSGTTDSSLYGVSTIRPTATVVVSDPTLSVGETAQVTIAFSEAVSGFSNADLTVANGTLGTVSSSDGGVTWTATLTPDAGVADSSNVIVLDNTGVVNAAGNAGAGTTASNNYAVATVPPVITRPTATVIVGDASLRAGQTSLVTITFSEPVTGFTAADLTVPHASLGALSSPDGGVTWRATLTPDAVTASSNAVVLDLSGVSGAGGWPGIGTVVSNTYAIDSFAPSSVASGPQRTRSTGWTVTYEVADDTAVASVALFVRRPGESGFEEVAVDTAAQDGSFTVAGDVDGDYAYYTVASDPAGNVEAVPDTADATSVLDRTPPAIVSRMGRAPVRFDLVSERRLPLRVRVGEMSAVALRIVDRRGTVRGFRGERHVVGSVSRRWNGQDAAGRPVGPGRYRLVVVARDPAGNRTRLAVPIRVTQR